MSLQHHTLCRILGGLTNLAEIREYQALLEERAYLAYLAKAEANLAKDGYVVVDRELPELETTGHYKLSFHLDVPLIVQERGVRLNGPIEWSVRSTIASRMKWRPNLELIPAIPDEKTLALLRSQYEADQLWNMDHEGIPSEIGDEFTASWSVWFYYQLQSKFSRGTYWCLNDKNVVKQHTIEETLCPPYYLLEAVNPE